jgi:hypothetical protein
VALVSVQGYLSELGMTAGFASWKEFCALLYRRRCSQQSNPYHRSNICRTSSVKYRLDSTPILFVNVPEKSRGDSLHHVLGRKTVIAVSGKDLPDDARVPPSRGPCVCVLDENKNVSDAKNYGFGLGLSVASSCRRNGWT